MSKALAAFFAISLLNTIAAHADAPRSITCRTSEKNGLTLTARLTRDTDHCNQNRLRTFGETCYSVRLTDTDGSVHNGHGTYNEENSSLLFGLSTRPLATPATSEFFELTLGFLASQAGLFNYDAGGDVYLLTCTTR